MAFKTFVLWLVCVAVFLGVGYYILESPDVSFTPTQHTGFGYFRVLNYELRMDGLLTLTLQNGGNDIRLKNVSVNDGSGFRTVEWLTPGREENRYEPYQEMQMVVKTGIRGEYKDPYDFSLKVNYLTNLEHYDTSKLTGRFAPLRT